MLKYLYHKIMLSYSTWRLKREIAKLKKQGKMHNLPSLDGYTDEQIVEGFRQYYEQKRNSGY